MCTFAYSQSILWSARDSSSVAAAAATASTAATCINTYNNHPFEKIYDSFSPPLFSLIVGFIGFCCCLYFDSLWLFAQVIQYMELGLFCVFRCLFSALTIALPLYFPLCFFFIFISILFRTKIFSTYWRLSSNERQQQNELTRRIDKSFRARVCVCILYLSVIVLYVLFSMCNKDPSKL